MGKPAGLAKEQRRVLDRLKAVPGLERFYLAGGSAIAVHLHHRRSIDLDLFSLSSSLTTNEARAVASEVLLPGIYAERAFLFAALLQITVAAQKLPI